MVSEIHTEYEQLKYAISKYYQDFDYSLLDRAFEYASNAHNGQNRATGEPYIMHPLQVAKILSEYELDIVSIVAGLLHDVVEDTSETLEDVSGQFGDTIAQIVDGVTKLTNIPFTTKEEQQAESLRKMILAMSKDIRVILIKLADRLHNMRTMCEMPYEHRVQKSSETLEIYAPLANRLGIFRMQSELEDLSFSFLEPQVYNELVKSLALNKPEREASIADVASLLDKRIREIHIEANIEYRMKHLYSIYKKMQSQIKQLDEIYDIFALRVIVNYVSECYSVLGKVHEEFKPIPGRLKDYIAMPKSNQYQSLHTTLIGDSGTPFEVQIRTWEMHRVAEFGIAAHWRYKSVGAQNAGSLSAGANNTSSYNTSAYTTSVLDADDHHILTSASSAAGTTSTTLAAKPLMINEAPGNNGASLHEETQQGLEQSDKGFDLNDNTFKLTWLRQLIDLQIDAQDSDDFVKDIKNDLFSDTVFAFSPKGDVFDLPSGSTPIDFAYRVHSAIGNRMNGARVNGRIVPISYELQNGDIVEIITSVNEHGPSRDWLDIVKSGQARSKIRQWFKRENRDENIVRGKDLVEREIKRQGFLPPQLLKPEWIDRLLKRYNFNTIDDVYSAVGYEGISSTKIVFRLVEEFRSTEKSATNLGADGSVADYTQQSSQEIPETVKKPSKQPDSEILVRGLSNCLVRLMHCCNPVPGDKIIGYITRSRGVSVHRHDCANVVNAIDDSNRMIEVSWYERIAEKYQAAILIEANDRPALLSDITKSIGEIKIPIKSINAKVSRDNIATIDLLLEIIDKLQLDQIIRKINVIESVLKVSRSIH